MDSIVTARIPVEVKNQVSGILESLGSNTTKLINAAFDYVLATGELPCAEKPVESKPSSKTKIRKLSKGDKEDLARLFKKISIPAPASFWKEVGGSTYKEAVSEWKTKDYETLG